MLFHDSAIQILDDLGPVGGASRGRYVRAENGLDYIIKGPSLNPEARYIAANELVAAKLAHQLGLPLLDFAVVQMRDDLFFASNYMTDGTYYPQVTEELFDSCDNRDRSYPRVVFDTWLCNEDRHEGNLLVRAIKRASGDVRMLVPNDHSHCLVIGKETPDALATRLDVPPGGKYLKLPFLARAIRETAKLSVAITAVERIDESVLVGAVRSIPAPLLDVAGKQQYEEFLIQRRSRLRELFDGNRSCFPELSGGAL